METKTKRKSTTRHTKRKNGGSKLRLTSKSRSNSRGSFQSPKSASLDIFKYTNIAGADDKRRKKSIAKVLEYVKRPDFDVNVKNPANGHTILYELTNNAHAFYNSIKILLQHKNIQIDLDTLGLITSEYLSDEKIIELFQTNKKAKKLLKPFL